MAGMLHRNIDSATVPRSPPPPPLVDSARAKASGLFFRNASTEGHRVDIVYFTITAVVLYVVADRVLDALERRAGHRFEQRSLIFFAILLGMALVTFAVIRQWSGGG